jgi:dihydroflavonol-4-reductase
MGQTTLVTGATGLIGYNVVMSLLKRKRHVRALVRSLEKGKKLLPKEVELVDGDILNKPSLEQALQGCDVVYHVAGWPEQWKKDVSVFRKVNVDGTLNMMEAARKANIQKFIYTSTIDAFEGKKGEKYDESKIDEQPKGTAYERSKQQAFLEVRKAIEEGFPAICLHPSALYGPGPTDSPGINNFIIDLKKGKVPMLLPGGLPLVYSEDAGEGHVLAEEKGLIGESYILSENYYELYPLAEAIMKILGMNKKPPSVMPIPLVKMVSNLGEWFAGLTGKPPLVPKGQFHFLQWGAIPDSSKASKELGWEAIGLEEGLQKTVKYLGLMEE